jgi:hypothetical protein
MARKKKADDAPVAEAAVVESPVAEARTIIAGVLSDQAAVVIEGDATARPKKVYRRYSDARAAGIIEAMRARMLYILSKHGKTGDAERTANNALAGLVANLESK